MEFKVFPILILSLFLFLFIGSVNALNYYKIPNYIYSITDNVYLPTIQIENLANNDLSSDMTILGDFNGSDYSVIGNYYSPHNNLISVSNEREFYQNISCVSFGSYEVNNIGETLETRANIIENSLGSNLYLKTETEINTDNKVLIFNGSSLNVDSSGFIKNYYYKNSTPLNEFNFTDRVYNVMDYFSLNFKTCGKIPYEPLARDKYNVDIGYDTIRTLVSHRIFVFNSTSGLFNYSFNLIDKKYSNCGVGNIRYNLEMIGYYEIKDNTKFNLISTSASGSGFLSLKPNTLYAFQISSSIGCRNPLSGTKSVLFKEANYTNTYFEIKAVIPNWECGKWSDCINGSRFRVCKDLDENVPDKIEYEFCYVEPEEQIYLGFENYTNIDIWYPYYEYVGCNCFTDLKNVKYPSDEWIVFNSNATDEEKGMSGFLYDFVKLTSEQAFEGERSLKMWNLPPQVDIPYLQILPGDNIVSCQNLTYGQFPDLYQLITTNNTTSIFVERNITLPTEYMGVSFKTKKCPEPELKSTTPNFFSIKYCGDDRYYTHSQDKNEEVKGTITFYLKDTETDKFLYDYKSSVKYANKWEIREYSIDSLIPNKNYTIGLAVIPNSEVDNNYYCVYIDDLNLDFRSSPLICESTCEDSTEIKRICKDYENDICIVCEETIINFSENCLKSSDVIDKVKSCENYCGCEEYGKENDRYYNKYVGNLICNESVYGIENCCEYSVVENSEYCIEFCGEYETKEGIDLFSPIPEAKDRIEEANLPIWSANFLSPIMIIFYVLIALMSYLSYKTERWEIGVITALLILMGLGTIFPQLIFIVILITIIAGFILAKSIYPHRD